MPIIGITSCLMASLVAIAFPPEQTAPACGAGLRNIQIQLRFTARWIPLSEFRSGAQAVVGVILEDYLLVFCPRRLIRLNLLEHMGGVGVLIDYCCHAVNVSGYALETVDQCAFIWMFHLCPRLPLPSGVGIPS